MKKYRVTLEKLEPDGTTQLIDQCDSEGVMISLMTQHEGKDAERVAILGDIHVTALATLCRAIWDGVGEEALIEMQTVLAHSLSAGHFQQKEAAHAVSRQN